MSRGIVCAIGGVGVGLKFSVLRHPMPGETLLSSGVSYVNGGKASNQAIGAAHLGAQARLISTVGDDAFGEMALKILVSHGVGVEGVEVTNQAATMVGALLVDKNGENEVVVAPGALNTFTATALTGNRTLIETSDVCLVSLEIPISTARAALQIGRESGCLTILNPAPATNLQETRDLLSLCDIVTPNQSEANFLTGVTNPEDQAEALLKFGASAVVLTLGARGALVKARGKSAIFVPAKIVEVLDTSGAGDGFNAALAVALLSGDSLERAVARACEAASLIVQAPAFVEALHMWADMKWL